MSSSFHLGAHTLPYRREPLERALQGIAAAGFRQVGLWTDHAGAPLVSTTPSREEIAALRATLARSGLRAVTMFARRGAMETPEALLADLDLCAALEMPLLQAAGPWPYAQFPNQRKAEMRWFGEVERFLAHLDRAAPEAEQRGVTIVLKPHTGATATGEDLVDVIRRVGSPALRACWDAGNVRYYEGLDSEDDLERSGVAPLVKSVCIKDQRGGRAAANFPIPGEGEVDHPRMLRVLAAAGFDGPLLVERLDAPPTAEAIDTALAGARQFLERVVAEAEGGRGDARP